VITPNLRLTSMALLTGEQYQTNLSANEVGLSTTLGTFSRWTHRHPQRLKPVIVW
jgi:hypothetical protein